MKKNIRSRTMAAAVAGLLVTACGGGGGDQASAPVASPSGGAAATPAPTSYASTRDFTRDRSFTAFGVRVIGRSGSAQVAVADGVDADTGDVGFDFTAADRSYRARYRGETILVRTQARAPDATASYANDVYSDGGTILTRSDYDAGLSYVGSLYWSGIAANGDGRARERMMVFGARTVAADLPSSGSTSYQAGATFPYVLNDYAGYRTSGGGTITVNWSTRTVTSDFQMYDPGFGAGTGSSNSGVSGRRVTVRGTVDAAGRVSGTVTLDGRGSGAIDGSVFGPRAGEIGLVMLPDSATVGASPGVMLGKQ